MAGPFKMKAGKEGPMRKNFPSAFKKDKKSVQDNTRTPNVVIPTISESEKSYIKNQDIIEREKEDYVRDYDKATKIYNKNVGKTRQSEKDRKRYATEKANDGTLKDQIFNDGTS